MWRSETEMQQRTKKSSYFQMINCEEAKPKCSNAPKNLVILKTQTVDKRNRNAATHQKSSHFQMTNCGEAKNEVQQRTKKSSHFQTTNCWEAKNKVQQRSKKSSHFQTTNCGEGKTKCSNAPKNLVIFKWQTVDKRNRNAATHQKI